ncbi:unnamed protein product [Ranitomeya imitator]|uniref:Vomeronasal type-1 receptor n=1 Tax=Ranitomeya imitator TaxID=111125 RepID=A0ABN9LX29_9NEOB|nr:unnamed protein product [Ranitomeya imitator]
MILPCYMHHQNVLKKRFATILAVSGMEWACVFILDMVFNQDVPPEHARHATKPHSFYALLRKILEIAGSTSPLWLLYYVSGNVTT